MNGDKLKVAVLGATGMLGHMLCRYLDNKCDVVAVVRSSKNDFVTFQNRLDNVTWVWDIDVTDEAKLIDAIGQIKPDVVVNCIGVVKQLEEAKDPTVAIRINALLPHVIAKSCKAMKSKLITVSTDCVFSGAKGMYTENDTPDPVDLYGETKLLGEVDYDNHLTIRTSMIGRQLKGSSSLLEWFFSQSDVVNGFTKAIYSGLTTAALVEVIYKVMIEQPNLCGIYQVASTPINKFELLCKLNEVCGLKMDIAPENIFTCDRSILGDLFTDKTGIVTPSWDSMIEGIAQDFEFYEEMRKTN